MYLFLLYYSYARSQSNPHENDELAQNISQMLG